MEEKKLTDERIINSLKAVGKETLAFAYDKEQRRFEYVTAQEILDLIHCLQEHNGNEVRMRCDMQRKFDDLQNLCIEQKAEIERLKEMCSKSSYKDSWKNKFFKAQEEIERLTEELKYYRGELQ